MRFLWKACLVAGLAGCSGSSPQHDAGDTTRLTLLDQVAAIVAPRCGRGGCHDPVTKEHGMDLTTAAGIHADWVDKNGLDHCVNKLRKRVIPGDPDGSYVVAKISATTAFCELGNAMPPPPWPMLSAAEIDRIRAWIAAGAPFGDPVADAGATGVSDANAEASGDATISADGSIEPDGAATPDAGDPSACTATALCPDMSSCIGDSCDTRWECVAHFDDTLEHPCIDDMTPYCGCDGVTFYGSSTCPDRPYDHIGACDDGFNCDQTDLRCSAVAPSCPDGEYPAIVGGCYGPCVPITSCRCEGAWQCPDYQTRNGCFTGSRCGPYPLPS